MVTHILAPNILKHRLLTSVVLVSLLSACGTTNINKVKYNSSYLLKEKSNVNKNGQLNVAVKSKKDKDTVTVLKPFSFTQKITKKDTPIVERFSETKKIKLAADELPLNEFLHYVMGEVLQVSYILGDSVKVDENSLTLNLVESVSHRKLYSLVEDLLSERKYVIRYNDGIYYINQEEQLTSQGSVAYGYGNKIADIPLTSQEIWQLVPFNYAFNSGLQLPILRIAKVIVKPDPLQNMYILQGKRSEIIKAMEFIQLFDKPDAGKANVSMYRLEFTDTETIIPKLSALLRQEGISVGAGESVNQALSIVELPNINTLTLFANTKDIIARALFWLKKIDQPEQGEDLQYFIYPPEFSRASDLGESLQALFGGASVGGSTSAKSQNTKVNRSSAGAGVGNISLVIDERANSLIFQTTGEEYRKILPLIKRLDVMPKQIMLEVMIAEVKLTDEFKQGVSFNLTNKGAKNLTGGFDLSSGSAGLSYALTGTKGSFNVDLFQTNSHVNILSRPSLLVRDGVGADITVGDDIPTVGEIITDPTNGSQTSIVYRKTGVQLTVTPTINAQGVVIMEISQTISNQSPGSDAVAGSPIIFERSLKTEVVAESGQIIILGGLISKDRTESETGVPLFSSIPILGKLFDSSSDTNTKSELVIMVTPRVIESNSEWLSIRSKLQQELKFLELSD